MCLCVCVCVCVCLENLLLSLLTDQGVFGFVRGSSWDLVGIIRGSFGDCLGNVWGILWIGQGSCRGGLGVVRCCWEVGLTGCLVEVYGAGFDANC